MADSLSPAVALRVSLAELWRSPLFRAGLAVKLLAVLLLIPDLQRDLFLQFLPESLLQNPLDPWSAHLERLGSAAARDFPYGPVMALILAPLTLLGHGLDVLTGQDQGQWAGIGLRLTLLLADLAVLLLTLRLLPTERRLILLLYWLSPILFFATYWHGQLDVVPTALLLASLRLLLTRRRRPAALWLALAAAAKLSTLLALPFILVHLLKSRVHSGQTLRVMAVFTAAASLLLLPWIAGSPGFRGMVLGTPELEDIYALRLSFGSGERLFMLPLLFMALVYGIWRVGRVGPLLLLAGITAGTLLLLALTPASPGWFVWIAPFLVLYPTLKERQGPWLLGAFSLVVIAYLLLTATGPVVAGLDLDLSGPVRDVLAGILPERAQALLFTARSGLALILGLSLLGGILSRNDPFDLSARPVVIGIAGDSGVGKDTLSAALAGLFERNAVASLSGDDYHRFERGSPMWQHLTHLDPRANALARFSRDMLALASGKRVYGRHYDHRVGRFIPQETKARDILLVSGLHAFATATLSEAMDLKIYLLMEEDLRVFFKLRRDVKLRGHAPEAVRRAIERRANDYRSFVQPQQMVADLIFRLGAADPARLKDPLGEAGPGPLTLEIRARADLVLDEVLADFLALGGIAIRERYQPHTQAVELLLRDEDVPAGLIAAIARRRAGLALDLLGPRPVWQPGLTGVMQLIVLVQLATVPLARQRHRRRRPAGLEDAPDHYP